MTSQIYADLGGGLAMARPRPIVRSTPPEPAAAPAPRRQHVHAFSTANGWCSCGLRDNGDVAEGSPAWREKRAAA